MVRYRRARGRLPRLSGRPTGSFDSGRPDPCGQFHPIRYRSYFNDPKYG